MIYPVYIYGHPVLRRKSEDISSDYEDLDDFIKSMFETMYRANGVGLAAPQVGRNIRLFVIDASTGADEDPSLEGFKKVFINAKIHSRDGELVPMNEGCLSIPGIWEDVNRESRVHISYYDENWDFHDEVLEGLPARIIQHEYDHLDGILFTDKISPIRRRMVKGKLSGLSKGKLDVDYKTVTVR